MVRLRRRETEREYRVRRVIGTEIERERERERESRVKNGAIRIERGERGGRWKL